MEYLLSVMDIIKENGKLITYLYIVRLGLINIKTIKTLKIKESFLYKIKKCYY